MSTFKEPPRWAEMEGGAPAELQQLLVAARRDLPDATEMQAMGLTTGAILAACATGAVVGGVGSAAATGSLAHGGAAAPMVGATTGVTSAGGAATAASGTFLTKVAIGVLLASGAGAGLWVATSAEPEASQQSTSVDDAQQSAPVVSPPAEPAVETPPPPVEAPVVVQEPAATSDDPPVKEAAKAPASKPTEVALLRQAQQALKSDPQRALSLAQQHSRLYPSGHLNQEREVIRIEALRRLGRDTEAKRLGDRFEKRFPDSAHRSKVDTVEEGAQRPE